MWKKKRQLNAIQLPVKRQRDEGESPTELRGTMRKRKKTWRTNPQRTQRDRVGGRVKVCTWMHGWNKYMMVKRPSSLPFLTLSLSLLSCYMWCSPTCDNRLKGVKPLGTQMSMRTCGPRFFWKSDPARRAEGHSLSNSRASVPESHSYRSEANREEKDRPFAADRQPGTGYCSHVRHRSSVWDLAASSGGITDCNS